MGQRRGWGSGRAGAAAAHAGRAPGPKARPPRTDGRARARAPARGPRWRRARRQRAPRAQDRSVLHTGAARRARGTPGPRQRRRARLRRQAAGAPGLPARARPPGAHRRSAPATRPWIRASCLAFCAVSVGSRGRADGGASHARWAGRPGAPGAMAHGRNGWWELG
jgi:hypothetical protein